MIYFPSKLGDCFVLKSVSWGAIDSCGLRPLPEYVDVSDESHVYIQTWQSHRRGSAIFVTTVKLRGDVRCNTSLKLPIRFLLQLSKFFRYDVLC